LSASGGFRPLVGGDKPRHYKQSFTELVGVGFIPTRELACTGDDRRRRIAWFRLLIVGAVCSPELVEGSTAIYSVWQILMNEEFHMSAAAGRERPVKSRKKL